MKKLFITLVLALTVLVVYGQTDTVYAPVTKLVEVGAGGHSLGGDSKATSYVTVNALAAIVDTLYSHQITAALTDTTPTAAEIAAATGLTVAAAKGRHFAIQDSDGTLLMYIVWSDGTTWFFEALTAAS